MKFSMASKEKASIMREFMQLFTREVTVLRKKPKKINH